MKLKHAGIQVRDLKKSKRLLMRLLGLRSRWPVDKDWTLLQDSAGGMLALIKKGHQRHYAHIGFMVSSKKKVDVAHQKVKREGLKVSAPELHRDGAYGFYFQDYDGNPIEIICFPKKLALKNGK